MGGAIRVLSLFSGIGAFEKALDRLGVEYDLVNYCEIDRYASKAYSLIHGVPENLNLGDITKVDADSLPKDIDLITYGFPCQDISNAGKMKGLFNEDGTQTRSGLFFEALRIIEDTKPKYAIAENVKNLTSKKFNAQFQVVLASLESAGYNNYWKVLNAKDYGIPQNRERVFIVSIRQDIDDGSFEFPQPEVLICRLKDMLEKEVDEKYYMSEKAISYICSTGTKNFSYKPEIDLEVARPLTSTMHKSHGASQDNYVSDSFVKSDVKVDIVEGKPVTIQQVGNVNPSGRGQNGMVVDSEGIARTIDTNKGEGQKILVREATFKCIQVGQLYGTEKEPNPQAGRVYDADGLSPTISTCQGGNRMPKVIVREATKQGYAEAVEGDSINLEQPNSKTRRGRVGKGVAQTLTTSPQQGVVVNGKQ